MSERAGLAGSSGAMVGGAIVAAVVVIGAAFLINSRNAPVDVAPDAQSAGTQTPDAQTSVTTAVAPEARDDAKPAGLAATSDIVTHAPPSIDEVRLEPDGLTIIAGRAAPGSDVAVLLDGTRNTSVKTDAGGSFAAITILPPSPKAQVLTVVQTVDGTELASVGEVILAPQTQAVAIATPPTESVAIATPPTESVATATPPTEPVSGATAEVQAVATDTPQAQTAPAGTPQSEPATAALTETPPGPAQTETASAQDVLDDDKALAVTTPGTATAQTDATAAGVTTAQTDTGATAAATASAPAQAATDAPTDPATPPEIVAAAPAADAPTPAAPTPAAPVVLKSTAEGVEVLSNARPQVLENIELDTISYSLQGDVQLAGRAQIEAEVVRVYVNNRPIADLDVDDNGDWRGALPQIDTGVYTLRVDELNQAGQVTSRVETPFRREDPVLLAESDDITSPATRVTVQAGSSLWSIARERYGEGRLYVQLFEANKDRIRNPDLIFPGQVFDLPN